MPILLSQLHLLHLLVLHPRYWPHWTNVHFPNILFSYLLLTLNICCLCLQYPPISGTLPKLFRCSEAELITFFLLLKVPWNTLLLQHVSPWTAINSLPVFFHHYTGIPLKARATWFSSLLILLHPVQTWCTARAEKIFWMKEMNNEVKIWTN